MVSVGDWEQVVCSAAAEVFAGVGEGGRRDFRTTMRDNHIELMVDR